MNDNFGASYTLVEENDGQEVWLSNDARFSIGASGTGSWNSFCNNIPVDGSWAHIVDNQSGQDLAVYVPHFCVSDNFAGGVDLDPTVSNEDQQASVCTIIGAQEDVQRIMGTGGAATYNNVITMSSAALGWGAGSHG